MNLHHAEFAVENYDLSATLSSGQVFRWSLKDGAWTGMVGSRWVRLHSQNGKIIAETANASADWEWLRHFLQLDANLAGILASFPGDDEALQAAVRACAGLRLLRQEPWECLASFICSSTKRIVQIEQIVALLCERYGETVPVPGGHPPVKSFPGFARVAGLSEGALRECKLGFRAPYLLGAAQKLASGEVDLNRPFKLPLDEAREELLKLPGVGGKIADCVLLFAYGFPGAFPVDVWIMKALKRHYFLRRKVNPERLRKFIRSHFGAHAGYAQQYLFHYMRVKARESSAQQSILHASTTFSGTRAGRG